jgi:cytochrome c-type biogenesis protein CcmF
MLRPYLGNIGHTSVIIAFVAAVVSTYAYWQASRAENINTESWLKFARKTFYVHTLAIFTICASLLSIIFNHYFEYHYAWDNSSLSLPLGYAISCFWQDQEGSFLLWMFWNVVLGVILINTTLRKTKNNGMEGPTMTIFALVQVFLASMILGVVLWGEFKIGSSPFLTLKESMPNIPIWKTNPNFIPKDGNGLNPLLQNYWMVIHPPTLFLGFAMTLVPFAFCIAGLWKKQYTQWIKPALPWTLMGAVILGTGIMMGGIWAYETLNFGGYWNWDPVENAVYVPWLVLVGSFHTMLLARKSSTALKYTVILVITQFILIVYSTFLARSGILGNASVHSFTDLGLSGQLLIYLLTFIVFAVALSAIRWKHLPQDEVEISTYSREFWVFTGVLMLCLSAFQVIVTTSIPVYNKIAEVFGGKLNMALPTNQVQHFTQFQLWFFIAITALSGVAQFFWWKRIQKESLSKLLNPLIISLLTSALIITFAKVNDWKYIVLLTATMFSIAANGSILTDILKGKFKVAGGAISHIGIALMLLGIMFSSGYSKVVSLNFSGAKIFTNESDNKENALLWLNRPTELSDFSFTYKGQFVDVRNVPGYIEKKYIMPVPGSNYKGIARADVVDGDKTFYKRGDTLEFEGENTYYQIEYTDKSGKHFNMYPRTQNNEKMGRVDSPDIKKFWNKDIYAFVSGPPVAEDERDWSRPEEFAVAVGDTFFVNDYVAILENVEGIKEVDGMALAEGDAAARASVKILDRDVSVIMQPVFAIRNREIWSKPEVNNEMGLRLQLTKIDPVSGKFSFSASQGQREFLVMKATEKPHINLLWFGFLLVIVGITLATIRRFRIVGTE